MYILSQQNDANVFYIYEDRQYTIGRKNADLILLDDQSISRKHAVITLVKGVLCLQDCSSKYGTFHQEKKLTPETQVQLQHNDTVKFGVFQSIFTVIQMDIITTSSALNQAEKKTLKNVCSSFGGTLLDDWSLECTHLTANEIMLTVKLLLALIDEKPLVTSEFWKKFSTAVKNREPLPKPEDYKPPLAETFLRTNVSLQHDKRRKFLFKNKTFVFPIKKLLLRMEDLIKRTGGTAISWDQQRLSFEVVMKNLQKYVFIVDGNKPIEASLKDVHEKLAKLGRRTIPLQEIAMAVLLISTEKDCNPNFNRVAEVFNSGDGSQNDFKSQIFPLAVATQSQDYQSTTSLKQEIVIPSSFDEGFLLPIAKRLQGESPPDIPPPKKIKQEIKSDSKKRKSDYSFLEAPAAKKTTLEVNPFAMFKSRTIKTEKTASDNPFGKIRIVDEKKIENNPFMMRHSLETKENNEKVAEEIDLMSQNSNNSEPLSQNISTINSTWLSKSDIKDDDIKIAEEDLKSVFEKFKNTVVIEVVPLRSIPFQDVTDRSMDPSFERKNFKKFKKVKPLRPQTNIITTSIYHEDSVLIKEENLEDEEEIEEPVFNNSRFKKEINVSSRFVF